MHRHSLIITLLVLVVAIVAALVFYRQTGGEQVAEEPLSKPPETPYLALGLSPEEDAYLEKVRSAEQEVSAVNEKLDRHVETYSEDPRLYLDPEWRKKYAAITGKWLAAVEQLDELAPPERLQDFHNALMARSDAFERVNHLAQTAATTSDLQHLRSLWEMMGEALRECVKAQDRVWAEECQFYGEEPALPERVWPTPEPLPIPPDPRLEVRL